MRFNASLPGSSLPPQSAHHAAAHHAAAHHAAAHHAAGPLRAALAGLILAATALAGTGAEAFERAALARAFESITSSELERHVDVLADDTFEGREAGTRGGYAAANYLARQMQDAGLQPAGDTGSYFQGFGAGYRNVLGLLEGSDPQLKHEVIVIGGHYDHVGYGSRRNSYGPIGYIHNGADDNASGVSGVLEVLNAMRELPSPPRRSILFAFWDGEEKGLLGSKHWAASPTVAMNRVKFALNVDMIGWLRNERVEVFGIRTGYGLRQLVARQNQDLGLLLAPTWELKSNSDHYSLYSRNVPVLMFHTGLHDHYHRPSDDAHLLNVEGMERVARLMFNVLIDLAERDESIRFRPESSSETEAGRQAFEVPGTTPAPRLGLDWQWNEQESTLHVTSVTAGSAAERAGLAIGDRITTLDGEPIRSAERFQLQVLAAEQPLKLGVVRRNAPTLETAASSNQVMVVELDGQPARIGISWRSDPANPGTVLVATVTPRSAADLAGLQPGDRIFEVAHSPYSSSDELLERLTTLPAPLPLLIERQGRLKEVSLELLDRN